MNILMLIYGTKMKSGIKESRTSQSVETIN